MTSNERRRSSKSSHKSRSNSNEYTSSSHYVRSDSTKSKSHNSHNNINEDLSILRPLSHKLQSRLQLHDDNGCCHIHSHVQIARKKIMVGGWKILRTCPACDGEEIGLDDDRLSVCIGKSNRSTRSGGGDGHQRRGRSSTHIKKNTVETSTTPRYDGEGYCCLHPSIRVAKKKTMGGWKLLVNVCPDCEAEGISTMDTTSRGRRRSMSRNRSNRRSLSRGKSKTCNNDDDDTRSVSSAVSRLSARSSRSASKSTGGGVPRKVKNLKIRDQNRVPGRYSGYVDEKDRPDGR
jgi:hypothetical protein